MTFNRQTGPQRGGSGPSRGGSPIPPPRASQGNDWPCGDYLRKGYFDGQGNLWPELVCGEQIERMTKALGQAQGQVQLKPAQLRRFYGKAKNIEQKVDSGQSFASARTELLTLEPLAANTVARGNALEVFKVFIDKNVSLASRDEKHFREGFLVHFQSIVALFPYLNRR